MALYVYLKKPITIEYPKIKKHFVVNKRKFYKFLSLLMVLGGSLSIGIVALPIIYYQFILGPSLSKTEFIQPIPVVAAKELDLASQTDYTKASSWFPTAKPQSNLSSVSSYTISIPELKIKDATVIVGGEDLNRGLIHYGGTGLPGDYGVGVIFGHSILPVFYDPTSYRAIFSTLPTLKIGSVIKINYDGIEYKYNVYDKQVIEPTDVSILEQHYDGSYLFLVTCYPPGTYYKRLIIKTRLVKPD